MFCVNGMCKCICMYVIQYTMYVYVNACICACVCTCGYIYVWIYVVLLSATLVLDFFFSFNVLRNWHSRTSAHVLPLVWQHCVPWSPHKQRLCGFAYLCAHLYSRSQLELGFFVVFVVTYSIFPYLLYITDLHFCTFLNPLLILGFDTTWLSFL